MADVFNFYVQDDRSIQFNIAEPILLEDKDVTEFQFRIPKSLNGFDMSTWAWWFVYVNPKKEKYSYPLTLTDDEDEPEDYSVATFSINYGITEKEGGIQFALEVIDADEGGTVLHEWHTKTYSTSVTWTLQGNQVEYEEDITQDILSSIFEQIALNRQNIAVNKARIDNIAHLPDGSTTADAELIDIRVGANGETYPSAGDAVRGQISSLKEDLTNVYEKIRGSDNIYDPSMPTTVGWVTNTGEISDTGTGANFATTDYISVDKNTDYIVKNVRVGYAGGNSGSRILVALYDASKNYITGTYQNVVGVSPTVVSVSTGQATYLRVSTLPKHLEAVPQYGSFSTEVVYSDADLSQYIPYVPSVYENRMQIVGGYGAVTEDEYDADMSDVDERLNNVETNIVGISEVEYSKNIYDRNAQLTTGWLRDTGAVDATGTGANFATTDYIKVEKNTDYIIANERMNIPGASTGSRILMALYDSSKQYISDTYQNVVGITPMQVTFNSADAVYLRVSTLPQHMGIPTSEWALIVQKGSTLDGYTKYWVKHISNLYPQDNILFGKKYVACGDSLTAGDFTGYTDESGKTGVLSDAFSPEYGSYKTYPYWIASRNGMTLVNSGINGSVMAISKEYIDGIESAIDYRSPFSLQRYKDIPSDADYITLWFGVNDKDHTYLGTISDTTNETFYGAWNVVLPYLMENHPQAKIGIVITFGIPDSPYTQAVREVAEKWGVPYYDFPRCKQSPIIIRNKDTGYAVDQSIVDWKFNYYSVAETNHHPNLIAHEYESTCLEAWLRSL